VVVVVVVDAVPDIVMFTPRWLNQLYGGVPTKYIVQVLVFEAAVTLKRAMQVVE
jgi:hypothetical protein